MQQKTDDDRLKVILDEQKTDEANKDRLKVVVGKPWQDGIEVAGAKSTESAYLRIRGELWLLGLFGGLLLIFTVYGMVTGNEQILSEVFQLIRYGLVALISWILGRRAPPT